LATCVSAYANELTPSFRDPLAGDNASVHLIILLQLFFGCNYMQKAMFHALRKIREYSREHEMFCNQHGRVEAFGMQSVGNLTTQKPQDGDAGAGEELVA
jgi:hypothetical protein